MLFALFEADYPNAKNKIIVTFFARFEAEGIREQGAAA